MKYPSAIDFIIEKNRINASYNRESNYNLDIWALSRALNPETGVVSGSTTIELDMMDATMALRTYFLHHIFKGVQFLPDATLRAEAIIKTINEKKYVTYPHNYRFSLRGTKNKTESKVEEYAFNNLAASFNGEFRASKCGLRQFPANIFSRPISEETRLGRKFWIDILTVNKSGQLSVIELKAGHNAPLDLLIQAIDYGIFAHLFKKHISEYRFIDDKNIVQKKVAVYLIAENFHPAIIGNNETRGVISLINKNDFFDVHLIRFKWARNKITGVKRIPCV